LESGSPTAAFAGFFGAVSRLPAAAKSPRRFHTLGPSLPVVVVIRSDIAFSFGDGAVTTASKNPCGDDLPPTATGPVRPAAWAKDLREEMERQGWAMTLVLRLAASLTPYLALSCWNVSSCMSARPFDCSLRWGLPGVGLILAGGRLLKNWQDGLRMLEKRWTAISRPRPFRNARTAGLAVCPMAKVQNPALAASVAFLFAWLILGVLVFAKVI
jgi:hypothetical protein